MTEVHQSAVSWILNWKRYFCFLVSTVYQSMDGPHYTKELKCEREKARKELDELQLISASSPNPKVFEARMVELNKDISEINELLPTRKGPRRRTHRNIWLGLLRGLEKGAVNDEATRQIYHYLTNDFIDWQQRYFWTDSDQLKDEFYSDGDLKIFTLTKGLDDIEAKKAMRELRKTAWRGLLIVDGTGRKAFNQHEKEVKHRLSKTFRNYPIPKYADSPHLPSAFSKDTLWAFIDF